MKARANVAAALVCGALVGCGESERERVEEAVRDREELLAEPIDGVRCERAEVMWGCSVLLRDGRTQACQVSVDADGSPSGIGCQPIQAE